MSTATEATHLAMPIQEAPEGSVLCPVHPAPETDACFADWESPFVWRHVPSRIEADHFFRGEKCLHFSFERREPKQIWMANWSLWYDTALVTRDDTPADATIEATLGFEEVTTGYGSDNNAHVNPWVGIVARMQDVRRYYFYCIEYPNKVTLYRREDDQWHVVGRHHQRLNVWTPYTLKLAMRGSRFEAFVDGAPVFQVHDYAYRTGRAGVRASCSGGMTAWTLTAEERGTRAHAQVRAAAAEALTTARAAVAAPVLKAAVDLAPIGIMGNIQAGAFTRAAKPMQLLGQLREGHEHNARMVQEGDSHAVFELDGSVIWKAAIPGMTRCMPTTPNAEGLSHVMGFSKDRLYLVDGATGRILIERPYDSLIHPPAKPMSFLPNTQVDLTGSGSPRAYILTQGANAPGFWVVDENLECLWYAETPTGLGHGNHVAVCDIDGDGREEIFAGGAVFDAEGNQLWEQPEIVERLLAPNAGHVDSAVMGFFGEPGDPPTLHMAASSAGHLVVDARTGQMLAAHPQGHCQGICAGAFDPETPGLQVASCNRWGNYGLTGVYSGMGRRVGRFQPDYETDDPEAANWSADGRELILIGGDGRRVGLYDIQGRRVVDLTPFAPTVERFVFRGANGDKLACRLYDDPRDAILLRSRETLHIIVPADPLPPRPAYYTPTRRSTISLPGWTRAESL